MKGPSLDAIRKFKEQQERKKREEDERRIQEKVSTLAHRAAQGDRKAKQELKRIEKVKEEKCNKANDLQNNVRKHANTIDARKQPASSKTQGNGVRRPPPVADFDELMKIAKNNTNEIKKLKEPIKPTTQVKLTSSSRLEPKQQEKSKPVNKQATIQIAKQVTRQMTSQVAKQVRPLVRPPQSHRRYDDEDDEDDYEEDGFVVDDEDDNVQEELSKTLRSVFRYDKRRCDLREEELDRQYRAIGRVSTFEDLEREERRASRLAAAEDARAFKDEEERKRLKKLRLQKS